MGIFVIYERIRSFRHYMLEIKYVLLHNKIRKSVVNFKESNLVICQANF